jgi:hypothetical protein
MLAPLFIESHALLIQQYRLQHAEQPWRAARPAAGEGERV